MRHQHKARSDHDLLAVGIALKSPSPAASERRARCERILHVGAEALLDFCEHRKWRGHNFRQDDRLVGEPTDIAAYPSEPKSASG